MENSSLESTPEKEFKHTVSQGEDQKVHKWQERLLPLMTRVIVGLTIFFFVASLIQLAILHLRIGNEPKFDMLESFTFIPPDAVLTPKDRLNAMKAKASIIMEINTVKRRYHQVNSALASRVWIRYIGFVTGMILAMVGAVFILGKLQGPRSELDAKFQETELSFKSASPGIVLSLLGAILMITTIVTHHKIDMIDQSVYLQEWQKQSGTSFLTNGKLESSKSVVELTPPDQLRNQSKIQKNK
jgi:hypothetical protein